RVGDRGVVALRRRARRRGGGDRRQPVAGPRGWAGRGRARRAAGAASGEEGPMTTLELNSPLAGLSGDAYRITARDWLARNAPQQFLADHAGYTAPTVPELKQWEA